MNLDIIIGSHVKANKANNYLIGSFEESLANGANAMMIYTGAPQNSKRSPIEDYRIQEFKALMLEYNLPLSRVIIHAPYLINLGNTIKTYVYASSVTMLKREFVRAAAVGAEILVLHPGSAVGADPDTAIAQIIKGLNEALEKDQTVKVALETMAGKGSDVGINFEQLQTIIEGVNYKEKVGVCWDTCHLYDAGYDIKNRLDEVIDEFDQKIGLNKLFVMHINDSKLPMHGARDRHANIGYGYLGFDAICRIVHHPRFKHIVKILETPYINNKSPYAAEIKMLQEQKFTDPFAGELVKII